MVPAGPEIGLQVQRREKAGQVAPHEHTDVTLSRTIRKDDTAGEIKKTWKDTGRS